MSGLRKTFNTSAMSELFEIFMVFFKIGALTFGGGYTMLPLLQRDIVRSRRWATDEEILDFYAISQSLPGIVAANTAMFIGHRRGRTPGLIAAVCGVAFPSLIIILVIAAFIKNFLDIEAVRHAFNGIRVAVAALIAGTTVKMWRGCVKDTARMIIFLAALAVFTFADVSPITPVVAGALAGVALARLKPGGGVL